VIQERVSSDISSSPRSWAAPLLERLGLTRELVRFALIVFAASRVGLLALTVGVVRLTQLPARATNPLFAPWERYDATLYATNAVYGYSASVPARDAFFPLQSLATALLRPLFLGDASLAGIAVANVTFFVALLGMAALVARDADEATARRAMVYLTVFPSALFFFAGYPESLFLALAVWCFVALRRQAWWQAGVLGLLAALTRQSGMLLVIPFAWEYAASRDWQWRRLRIDALALALIPGGLLIFMAVLWIAAGDPLGMFHAQEAWHRTFEPPWQSFARAVPFLLQQRTLLTVARWGADFAADLFFLGLIALGYRRIPTSELLFAAAVWLLAVSYPPVTNWSLLSNARFMLEAFPCFFVLARLTSRRSLFILVAVVFAIGLAVLTQYFLRDQFIL
jgi:hypothetical protein